MMSAEVGGLSLRGMAGPAVQRVDERVGTCAIGSWMAAGMWLITRAITGLNVLLCRQPIR